MKFGTYDLSLFVIKIGHVENFNDNEEIQHFDMRYIHLKRDDLSGPAAGGRMRRHPRSFLLPTYRFDKL